MSYDALAESLRLLEGGAPESEARLSRRVRFVPLAADRDGDVAATMFLRRGVSGVPELDVHSLELYDGRWRMLGGSGGPGAAALEPRPDCASLQALAVSFGSGGTARGSSRSLGWAPNPWVWWTELRAAREVAALGVGERRIPVAAHGMAIVVWTDRPPEIAALDASGVVLGAIPVRDRRSMPAVYRDGDEPR